RLEGLYELVNWLAVRSGKKHTAGDGTALVDVLGQDVVVEHRLVHRDRERFIRTEPDRIGKLALVGDAVDVDRLDADPTCPDADADPLPGQPVHRKEGIQRLRECLHIANLTRNDDSRLEFHTGNLSQPR